MAASENARAYKGRPESDHGFWVSRNGKLQAGFSNLEEKIRKYRLVSFFTDEIPGQETKKT